MSLHSDDVYLPTPRTAEEIATLISEQDARCLAFEENFLDTTSGRNPEDVIIVTYTGCTPNDWRFAENRYFFLIDVLGICQAGGTDAYFEENPHRNGWGGFRGTKHIHKIQHEGLRAWVESVPFTEGDPYAEVFAACVKRAAQLGYVFSLVKSYSKYDIKAVKV